MTFSGRTCSSWLVVCSCLFLLLDSVQQTSAVTCRVGLKDAELSTEMTTKDDCRSCGKTSVLLQKSPEVQISVNYTCEVVQSNNVVSTWLNADCSNTREVTIDVENEHVIVSCSCCSKLCNERTSFCNYMIANFRRKRQSSLCPGSPQSGGSWNTWSPSGWNPFLGTWSCWQNVPNWNAQPTQQQQQQQQQGGWPPGVNAAWTAPTSSNVGGPVQAVQVNTGAGGGGGNSPGFSSSWLGWPPGSAPTKWIHFDLSIVGSASGLLCETTAKFLSVQFFIVALTILIFNRLSTTY